MGELFADIFEGFVKTLLLILILVLSLWGIVIIYVVWFILNFLVQTLEIPLTGTQVGAFMFVATWAYMVIRKPDIRMHE